MMSFDLLVLFTFFLGRSSYLSSSGFSTSHMIQGFSEMFPEVSLVFLSVF